MNKELAHALCASGAPIVQDLANQWMTHYKRKKNPVETGRKYFETEGNISVYHAARPAFITAICFCSAIVLIAVVAAFVSGPLNRIVYGCVAALFTFFASYSGFLFYKSRERWGADKEWMNYHDLEISSFEDFIKDIEKLLEENEISLSDLLGLSFEQLRGIIHMKLHQWGAVVTLLKDTPMLAEIAGRFQSDMIAIYREAKKFALTLESSFEGYFPKKEVSRN